MGWAQRLTPLAHNSSNSTCRLGYILPLGEAHLRWLELVFLSPKRIHCKIFHSIVTSTMLSAPSNRLVKMEFSYPPRRNGFRKITVTQPIETAGLNSGALRGQTWHVIEVCSPSEDSVP